MARESVLDNWRKRWWHRGEPLAVAGFTAAVGSAATGRWALLGVSLGAVCLGIYIVGTAESRMWLPGRRRVANRASNDALDAVFSEQGGAGADAILIAREVRCLNSTLRDYYGLMTGDREEQLAGVDR
jgi:hypothetical protein